MNIYTYINEIDGNLIFLYVIILIVSFYFFSYKTITLSIIFSVFIGLFIIIYLNEKNKVTTGNEKQDIDTQLKNITPTPERFDNYPDIIKFAFSIQDFYIYNPQAFENIIYDIDAFLLMYTNIKKDNSLTNELYDLMENKKNSSLNNLHSIIYNMPNYKNLIEKLNNALQYLESLLNNYLEEIYKIHQNNVYMNGYNIKYKIVNTFPKSYNYYPNNKYMFEFF